MSASFSLSALLRGNLAPTRARRRASGAAFHSRRRRQRSARLGDQKWQRAESSGPRSSEQAAGPPKPPSAVRARCAGLWSATPRLSSTTGGPAGVGRQTGSTPRSNATPQGLAGDLSLAMPIGARTPELHARYRYSSAERNARSGGGDRCGRTRGPGRARPRAGAAGGRQFPVSGTLDDPARPRSD